MAKKTAQLLPTTGELLLQFGERLRLSRLRRRLSAKQVAERAGMAPMTLRSLERGGAGVTMGAYLSVMQVMGIEKDLNLLGQTDPAGRELQDARMPAASTKRLPLRGSPRALKVAVAGGSEPTKATRARPKSSPPAPDWVKQGSFASADALAELIHLPPVHKKKRR
jgi:transcriptional regulator with XRE-family HTH domain